VRRAFAAFVPAGAVDAVAKSDASVAAAPTSTQRNRNACRQRMLGFEAAAALPKALA
jgi:hypothetical protein